MPGMLPELLSQDDELLDSDEDISPGIEEFLVHLPPPLLQLLHVSCSLSVSPAPSEARLLVHDVRMALPACKTTVVYSNNSTPIEWSVIH
jgi:hypothetical protein